MTCRCVAGAKYLTTKQAAAYCGFKSTAGIYSALRRGQLRASRRGGTGDYVFSEKDLDEYMGQPVATPDSVESSRPAVRPVKSKPRPANRGPRRLSAAETRSRDRDVAAALERLRDLSLRGRR